MAVAGEALMPLSLAQEPIHPVYLPFSRERLLQHFALVGKPSAAQISDRVYAERHLKYYEDSAGIALGHEREQHSQPGPAGGKPLTCTAQNHQVEKDERFWIVTALMSIFHSADRTANLTRLLTSAFPEFPTFAAEEGRADLPDWAAALQEDADHPLQLFFEVSLPSPERYRQWLADRVDRQTLLPWIRAKNVGLRQEGATKADAMLIAPKTGVAIVFEAKVLSDASSHTERDATRNQIARNIDVLLDTNPKLQPPLTARRPGRTSFVLVTPELFQSQPSTRLYGHLMNEYCKGTALLQQHLQHRTGEELDGVPNRLGWTTFEEFNRVLPGACVWLLRCEQCGAQLVPVQYGYPAGDFIGAADRHELILAGCSVEPGQPSWACAECPLPPLW